MPETDIGEAIEGSFQDKLKDFSVDSETTDGASESGETRYTNTNWPQQLGYFKNIAEVNLTIKTKSTWTVGKGFKADPETTIILDAIKGIGKDTFNTILENLIRTYHIGTDAFAEIILDEDEVLINLKPLDPSSMVTITDQSGMIIRYEQTSKIKGKKNKRFKPEEIFHLMRDRVADEIHGNSLVDILTSLILKGNEAMEDWQTALHSNVVPQIIWHLDTDNTTRIANFKATREKAGAARNDIYIPKGAVEREIAGIPGNAVLNPLPWIEMITKRFYQAGGVQGLIPGGSQNITDAATKMDYLISQQTIEEEQLYMEEQVLSQLNLEIELEFPASLESGLLSEEQEEEDLEANKPEIENQQGTEPNDTTAELEGKT